MHGSGALLACPFFFHEFLSFLCVWLKAMAKGNVYLYVPNLIGYARVVLALVGYGNALVNYKLMVCYLLSQLLDAADGYAARLLKQSSSFGAVLDMVTDRVSTTCLCVVLGRLYPEYLLGLCSLVMLDMFSHW